MEEKKTQRRPMTVPEVAIELAAICEANHYQPPKSTLTMVTDFAAKHGAVNAARFLTLIRWRHQNDHTLSPEFELLAKNNAEARAAFEVYSPAMKEVES